ncbi:response regulator transcription factor [Pontibacter flavimaris]|uniref:DNA-binding response regulator n=1 Tax=Pontibacter flavimaris TaxID=1797110 RepID=A0A1Q5P8Y3_9BACT|nr:response regulator transcription factor [Pontibacter flavimaris]OKL38602.1 DNA-binding response regulator [Pontibacter flavimaris]
MIENSTIRTIITDDHRIVREGLRSLLERDGEIEVVGEAGNGQDLLQLLTYTAADVVLLDVSMPVMDGFETLQHLKKQYPDLNVIVLTMLDSPATLHRLMESGAIGYLLKDTGADELCTAIKLASKGTPFISSGMSMKIVQKAMQPAEESGAKAGGKFLSKREREVLALISEGYTNAEIAEKLFTSKRTIETHRQNILEKTQAKNTPNLIRYAILHNLIDLNSN